VRPGGSAAAAAGTGKVAVLHSTVPDGLALLRRFAALDRAGRLSLIACMMRISVGDVTPDEAYRLWQEATAP